MWWILPAAAVAALLAVVLVRALMFRPKQELTPRAQKVDFDEAAAQEHLAQMIRLRTVGDANGEPLETSEFLRFEELLQNTYPTVHAKCEKQKPGGTAIVYKLKGKNAGAPSVFMAHYDVVPANAEAWQHEPFCGQVFDGELWGRGTLDTKSTLLGVMEAAETLLKEGFVPEHDIYLAFSGDEETTGASAQRVVAQFKAQGISPAFVLDEGGAVVENIFPGVRQRSALIGISEKGPLNVAFHMKSNGGHASTPPPRSEIGMLADAVHAIETHPFPGRLTKPTAEMFDLMGRHSTFVYRIIFANLWLFRGVLDMICKKGGGELNAIMRTTCAFTVMQGSSAYNVLPPQAHVGANLRILPGETVETTVARLKRTIANDRITVEPQSLAMDPAPCSHTDCAQYTQLAQAIKDTWGGDVLVSPYLMLACSDARHYAQISEYVYRFSPMELSKQQRAMIHGNDERIPLQSIGKIVAFYLRMMKTR